MRLGVALVLAAAGCGRIGFGPNDVPIDAPAIPADAAPCVGTAVQLPVDPGGGGTWVTALTGTSTQAGFAMSYVAPDGVPFALSFSVTNGTASELLADTNIDANVGAAQGVALAEYGGRLLSATDYMTQVLTRPFDESFAPITTPDTRSGRRVVSRPLAVAGNSTSLALLDKDAGDEIDGHLVDITTGSDVATSTPLVAASQVGTSAQIVAADPGFLVTWIASGVVRGELADPQLAITAAPAPIGSTNALEAVAAWAQNQHRALVVWTQLDGSAMDVWGQLVDDTLAPIGAATMLRANAHAPKVASDGNSFVIVVTDPTAATHLSGVHVTASGAVTTFAVTGSGGNEVDHDVVAHAGAVELLWMERAGTGDPLWVVPACTLIQ